MIADEGIGGMVKKIAEAANPQPSPPQASVEKWPAALVTLISARIAIISAESGEAFSVAARKVLIGLIGAFSIVVCWLLLLVALMGAIPAVSTLLWYHVAFIAAGFHLLLVIIAFLGLKKKSAPIFTITKSEFNKDRQWLTNVKNESISKN